MKVKNAKDEIADGNPELYGLRSEIALCLDKHKLSTENGDQEILACRSIVKLNKTELSTSFCLEIDRSDLCKLYNESCALKLDPKNIIALKIWFGEYDNNVELFFEPLALALQNSVTDAELQNQGIFNSVRSGKTYKYFNHNFNEAQIGNSVYRYQNGVEIMHNNEDGWGKFICGKDVESVTFTFQEIFNFLHENSAGTLRIFNCVRRFDTIGKGIINKHSLVLAEIGPDAGSPNFEEDLEKLTSQTLVYLKDKNLFAGRYSNLTHLCPPNCSQLMYTLEQINY